MEDRLEKTLKGLPNKQSGKPEFAVIPYDEFLQIQEKVDDYEDLMDLRGAKKQAENVYSMADVKKELRL
ncbi:MAG: type II toxin-antitoxin system Phd/YefM family antitoxin [Brevinematales bacterium]|nr:type II toxin-antitoxin system Phd/YefM family antitoxin [Brevinematales bacterium]